MTSEKWQQDAARAGLRYHFRHKSPWRHNLIGIAVLAAVALAVAGLIDLGRHTEAWVYIPLAGLGFGLLYYTLLAIPVHEASHGMMFLSKYAKRRKRWNRAIGWACSIPFGVHYRRHWEQGHVTHHIHPFEPDDPQAFNRSTGWPLLGLVAMLLVIPGAAFFHRFTVKRESGHGGSSPVVFLLFAAFWAAVFTVTWRFLGWKETLALAYGLQVLAALNQIKGALEHGGEIAFDGDRLLRSRSSMVPLRALFPMFYATVYHFEHHLNYAVPWYDLPRYHRDVLALVPEDLRSDIFNTDLLVQLAGHKGAIGRHRQAS